MRIKQTTLSKLSAKFAKALHEHSFSKPKSKFPPKILKSQKHQWIPSSPKFSKK
ncbi:unnamed protein product [Prunus brigantina]